jgi:hypothetical protein
MLLLDERRVRLRVNGDLFITSRSKSGSSSAGDGSKDVKMGYLIGARILLTMANTPHTFHGEGTHASCVQIAILSSTVSFGA